MREYDDYGEYRDDHIRLYTPVLQRVIILTGGHHRRTGADVDRHHFRPQLCRAPQGAGTATRRRIGKPAARAGGIAGAIHPSSTAARSTRRRAAARRYSLAAKRCPADAWSRHQERFAYCAVR